MSILLCYVHCKSMLCPRFCGHRIVKTMLCPYFSKTILHWFYKNYLEIFAVENPESFKKIPKMIFFIDYLDFLKIAIRISFKYTLMALILH